MYEDWNTSSDKVSIEKINTGAWGPGDLVATVANTVEVGTLDPRGPSYSRSNI